MEISFYMILHRSRHQRYTPRKKHVQLKKLSSSGISVESYMICFPNFKIIVRIMNQKSAMYLAFQLIDMYDVHKS